MVYSIYSRLSCEVFVSVAVSRTVTTCIRVEIQCIGNWCLISELTCR